MKCQCWTLRNIFDVVCGALAFYLVGFGISHGTPSTPFMGLGDYFVDTSNEDVLNTGLVHSRYIFQFSSKALGHDRETYMVGVIDVAHVRFSMSLEAKRLKTWPNSRERSPKVPNSFGFKFS